MNAPFNHRALLREPYAAYMDDEASAEAIRIAAVGFGWPPECTVRGGLKETIHALAVSASPNILFVDLTHSADPLNELNGLAEVCEPGIVVIAVGAANDVRLYRELIASGIQDYLLKPFTAAQAREAFLAAQATLAGHRAGGETTPDRPHCMTAVIGARGGVGASSIATSIAWGMGDQAKRNTALLDLDVHFGTGALTLDLEPGRGLTDAIDNPSRIDGLFIERAMVRHSDQLAVLSAEAPMSQPLGPDATAFYQLQEEMRAAFDCTVIDLPRHMLVAFPALMRGVQTAVVVTELTLAGARDTIRILSWLKANAPDAKPVVVANKVPANAQFGEIARKEFETSIERPIDVLVPHDWKLAVQSAKVGKPLAEAGKGTKTAQALTELTALLTSNGDAKPARSRSLVGRLGEFKALIPTRKAKTA
ncbi:pilus assembly protein CpaE [Sphingomonas sp. ID0503]|uniref:pilus assembly protein CpaE n=1 Tax=Sphingomonas sp. ID0503 TaxID=3399691 RepID=UPI003AFB2573